MRIWRTILFFAIIALILFLMYRLFGEPDNILSKDYMFTLNEDGVLVLREQFQPDEVAHLKRLCENAEYKEAKNWIMNHGPLKHTIQMTVGPEHAFQDYLWIIQKSTVHTCHRDNNGDFFNEGQRHPSYTMLIYLENMEKCLGVIPGSHKNQTDHSVNITQNPLVYLPSSPGDVIIFNANLVHTGGLNPEDDHLRLQMKITHPEDLEVLHYYQDYNKVLKTENTNPLPVKYFQQRMSCMFPIASDLTQGENIRTARGSDDGIDVGTGQRAFSYLFYGNGNFYDLPNSF
jgi:hypothetical protein